MNQLLPIATTTQALAVLWRLVKARRRPAIVALLAGTFSGLCGIATPYALGQIIQLITDGQLTPASLTHWGIVAAVGAVACAVSGWFAVWTGRCWGEHIAAALRTDITHGAMALNMRQLENAPQNDLPARATTDVDEVVLVVRNFAPLLVVMLLQLAVYVVAIVVLAPLLTVIVLGIFGVLWGGLRWYLPRSPAAYQEELRAQAVLAGATAQTARGAHTLEALAAGPQRNSLVDRYSVAEFVARMRTMWLAVVLNPLGEGAVGLANVLVVTVGAGLVISGRMDVAALAATSGFVVRMIEPVTWLTNTSEKIQGGLASLKRVVGVSSATRQENPTTTPQGSDVVVQGVNFAYTEAAPLALQDVDLVVPAGQRLAVVGASGSGKSTLGRLIAGCDDPTTGTVTCGGVPASALAGVDAAKPVVLVTQEQHVFSGSLRDNLTLAAPQANDPDLWAALAVVGVDRAVFPTGLATELGVGGVDTEGTLAQQIALARVVLADPAVVVLDEATSLLNSTVASTAERALAAVLAGRTVISIAHRLHTAHDADRIVVLDQGSIAEQGSHTELVAAGGVYSKLWTTWHGE